MRKFVKALLFLSTILLIYSMGSIQCNLGDTTRASNNTFTAFNSYIWNQTTQEDFQAGLPWQVDTSSITGDVILGVSAGHNNYGNGSLASQVLNTNRTGTAVNVLSWNATTSPQTSITFYIRASDTRFAINNTTVPWINVGSASPVLSGLPKGQYIQWRVNLSTNDKHQTPDIQDVQVWYY